MEQWGEGSRAIVRVTRSKEADENQSGHVFVAVHTDGKTQYIDPQSGDMNCERYFNGCEPAETRFVQTDDREMRENANHYVRPRNQKQTACKGVFCQKGVFEWRKPETVHHLQKKVPPSSA